MTVDIADDTARPVEALPVVEDSVAVGEENGQEIRMAYRAVGPKHARTKLLTYHLYSCTVEVHCPLAIVY